MTIELSGNLGKILHKLGILTKHFLVILSADVVKHYINLSYSEECFETNNQLIWDKVNFTNSLVNAKNSLSNTLAGFNDVQRGAYEALIDEGKDADSFVDRQTNGSKPGFNMKIFIMGWFGAIVLYIFLYALFIVFTRRLNSSNTLADSYGIRVFGDVYYPNEVSGLRKIFRSKFVNRLYHHGALDCDAQIGRIASSVDAAVTGRDEDNVTLVVTAKDLSILNEIALKISGVLEADGKTINIVDAAGTAFDEKSFTDMKSAVLIADSDSRVDDVSRAVDLCGYYNVDLLGAV